MSDMSDAEFDSTGGYEDDDDLLPYDSDGIGTDDAEVSGLDMVDPITSIREKQKAYQVDHSVLSEEELTQRQNEESDQVADITGVNPSDAILLLRHFRWNKAVLIEKYMDSPKRVFEAAGVVAKAGVFEDDRARLSKLKPVQGFVCDVCYDDSPDMNTVALICEHRFCRNCYSTYVAQKIAEGESRSIECMASNCKRMVDEKTVEELVSVSDLARYKSLLNRTFVDDNPTLRFCPAPNCEFTIECEVSKKSLDTIIPTVTCLCGHRFCFGCGLGDHQPCICPIVKLWLKKCEDDSETANWISANTKECTECHATIEKNGGCNHMICKNCKYEFCWVCLGVWSTHGTAWYHCNRYEEKPVLKDDQQSKSRASLQRYLHYYNRFANHEQSLKLDRDLYAKTEKKMEEVQQSSNLSWIEVQFLRKAVDTLSVCRTTLKWTYAMAYYLERSNFTDLFEDNQRDLEQAVEDLSGLLEEPVEADTIVSLRQRVTDKTVYVHKRNQIMQEETANDYDDGRVKWNITLTI